MLPQAIFKLRCLLRVDVERKVEQQQHPLRGFGSTVIPRHASSCRPCGCAPSDPVHLQHHARWRWPLSLRIVAAADQQPEARLRNLGGRNADLVASVGYAVSVERDAARLGRELLDQMRLAEVGIDEERVGFDVTTTEATKDHLPFSAV